MTPLEQRLAQPQRRRGVAHERGRLLVGRRLRLELDAVLRGEIVELVGRPPGLDQIRGDHRVVLGLDAERLRVVRDEPAVEAEQAGA